MNQTTDDKNKELDNKIEKKSDSEVQPKDKPADSGNAPKAVEKTGGKFFNKAFKKRRPGGGKYGKGEKDEFEQKIIHIARVTRVMKGGKRMRFRACVAVGNKTGKIGIGLAKSADVTAAITKAADQAKKKIVNVQIIKGTIAHNLNHKFGAARIMLKPAKQGTGIIAGGALRIILELAGIKNIVGKILGTNNPVNNVKCVVEALSNLKHIDIPSNKAPATSPASGAGKQDTSNELQKNNEPQNNIKK